MLEHSRNGLFRLAPEAPERLPPAVARVAEKASMTGRETQSPNLCSVPSSGGGVNDGSATAGDTGFGSGPSHPVPSPTQYHHHFLPNPPPPENLSRGTPLENSLKYKKRNKIYFSKIWLVFISNSLCLNHSRGIIGRSGRLRAAPSAFFRNNLGVGN